MIERRSDEVEFWELSLKKLLPLLGHRNWIVIADSAYPAHSNPGIETVVTGRDHIEVLNATLSAIERSRHIRPTIYVDEEFKLVAEKDGPGVTQYRKQLVQVIGNREKLVLPHEQIIAKLDECARSFRVLILKSTLAIPYTSVFLELECGYWTREAEGSLRAALGKLQQRRNGHDNDRS